MTELCGDDQWTSTLPGAWPDEAGDGDREAARYWLDRNRVAPVRCLAEPADTTRGGLVSSPGYEDRLTELRAEIDKIRGQNTRRGARGAAAD